MSNRDVTAPVSSAPHPDWPDSCTVGPSAVTGERCGQPAVSWLQSSRSSRVYAECAQHAGHSAPWRSQQPIEDRGLPTDAGWEGEAMSWTPHAGDAEIHAWQDIFHDRRRR